MIKLLVIGNLGKDALTNVVNGKSVINFTVAHTEKFKDATGQQKEKTTWVDCAYWTERTAVAPYLKKGEQVYVEGTPEVRTFTRNDGTTGAALTLRVVSLQLVGRRPDGAGASEFSTSSAGLEKQQSANPEPNSAEDFNDDLPF